MPDPRATAITNRLAALYPELAQQLQGEEVARVISEELGGEERPWTYCHEELPTAAGEFEVAELVALIPRGERLKITRGRWAGWEDIGWSVDGEGPASVYAFRSLSEPPPLTPEARAYLEREGRR